MAQTSAQDLHFETHTGIQRFWRALLLPLFTALPASLLQKILRRSSKDAANVTKKSGSAFALEVMYTRHNRSLFSRGFFQGVADYIWHHVISQPMAVRNRLRVVESFLERSLKEKGQSGEKVEVLTIGGGSSRAFVHALKKLKLEGVDIRAHVVNVDKSPKIAELGRMMLEKEGQTQYIPLFTWITGDARKLPEVLPSSCRAHIVEMVGLLDYFNDEVAVVLFQNIKKAMAPDGVFIVGNICPHDEMQFIKKSGWPDMVYRTEKDLHDLVEKAGFERDRIEMITEPLGIHTIAIARA